MFQRATLVLTAAFLLTLPAPALPDAGPAALLPEGAEGWDRHGPDGVYGPEDLFDLIDGAAEIYLAFNVRRVVNRRYVSPKGADIIADVFDMGSPRDAYGAYHFDMREGETPGIGAESELVGSSLAFWKDRYFVTLTPLDDAPVIRKAVLSLGRQIAEAIPGDARAPDLVDLIPAEGLIESQIHYFHGERILGLLIPVTGKSLPGLSSDTEGIIARYRISEYPGAQPILLIVRYPSTDGARRAAEAVKREIASRREESGEGKERPHWAEARQAGNLLVAVLGGADREQARNLAEEVLTRVPERGRGKE